MPRSSVGCPGEVFERDAIIASSAAIVGVAVMVSSGLDAGIGWAILIVGFIPLELGMYSTLIRPVVMETLVPVLIAEVRGTGGRLSPPSAAAST